MMRCCDVLAQPLILRPQPHVPQPVIFIPHRPRIPHRLSQPAVVHILSPYPDIPVPLSLSPKSTISKVNRCGWMDGSGINCCKKRKRKGKESKGVGEKERGKCMPRHAILCRIQYPLSERVVFIYVFLLLAVKRGVKRRGERG